MNFIFSFSFQSKQGHWLTALSLFLGSIAESLNFADMTGSWRENEMRNSMIKQSDDRIYIHSERGNCLVGTEYSQDYRENVTLLVAQILKMPSKHQENIAM